jgi:predicted DCC family thiol-disulfide oxidoreductase YuxK
VTEAWDLQLFYDGACPLCSREIRFLEKRDRARSISFVDIAAEDFDAGGFGLASVDVTEKIHGKLPNGDTIEGLEVFRRAYSAVGLGWLLAPTGWPGLARLSDRAYQTFARNRLRWTGRSEKCDCSPAA